MIETGCDGKGGFNRVTKSVLAKFRAVCGAEHVIADRDKLVCYSYDATKQKYLPEAVVEPCSSDEVAAVLRIANEERVAVYVRGAATGLTGGAVPVYGGLVVDLKRMNRILDIDEDNLLAVVEPGVVTGEFQKVVEERGLFYPPDPASSDYCTIGGNVAEGAGGLRCVKYGVTRDYVLGLEMVMADGTVLKTGGRTIKNVTGYDLTRFMVGSEGTLGIITEVTLRLIPKPESVRTLVAQFATAEQALAVVVAIARAGIVPRALEFLDMYTLDALRQYSEHGFPQTAQSVLLIEVDGRRESVDRESSDVFDICRKEGAIDVERADTAADRDRAWSARRAVSPALFTIAKGKMNEDICVPKTRIIEILKFITELRDEVDLTIACFGHAGDGNLHVNFMYDPTDRGAVERAERGVEKLFYKTVEVGGTLSGEHGIGTSKREYLSIEISANALTLMRDLKRVFDPNGILNPGKIFHV